MATGIAVEDNSSLMTKCGELILCGRDSAGEGMEHNGERMFDVSLRLIRQRGKIETHFAAHAMLDQAWQPNTITKIMKFD